MRKLTAKEVEEIKALENIPDSEIDLSDIPEVTDWTGARIGEFFKPVKIHVSMRLDADIINFFKLNNTNYQTAINAALREYVLLARKKAIFENGAKAEDQHRDFPKSGLAKSRPKPGGGALAGESPKPKGGKGKVAA